ncbi:MAG: synthase subunit [Microvirga sp.]|nr:synthase subunit [Microvirga sp.]
MASPIEQFQIKPIIPVINFTNSSVFMIGAAAVIVGGLLYATRKRAVVPGRAQSVAEVLHDFVANTLVDATGKEGMKFFPLVFSLFMFVLTANLLGMIPGFFTPGWLLPFIVVIELISFLSRPISLSLRLFANMLAGHIALKVFAGFVVSLLAAGGALTILAPLPLLMAVALMALEFLVAALQAYVFTVLTCIYLNDALHPGH